MNVLNASGLELDNAESVHLVRQWYIDRNLNGRAEITNFREYVETANTLYPRMQYEPLTPDYDGWLILDWENEGMAMLRDGHWKHFVSFLNDVRVELPNAKIGYYGLPGLRILTRPDSPEWWRMCAATAEIVPHCDGIFPSVYQQGSEFYRDSHAYDIQVLAALEMASNTKPVYAFIANRWYDTMPGPALLPTPLDQMQAHCAQMATIQSGHTRRHIDGFVFYADIIEHHEGNRERFQSVVNMMEAIP